MRIGFIVSFVTVLILAGIGMAVDAVTAVGLRYRQPWTALVLWAMALVPGIWTALAWRRCDTRLRTLRRWLRVAN